MKEIEAMIKNEIRKYRLEFDGRGITKSKLSKYLGVTPSYVTKVEQGSIQPSPEMMFKIADFFGCEVSDIFIYSRNRKKR